jgi:hypothetical protein
MLVSPQLYVLFCVVNVPDLHPSECLNVALNELPVGGVPMK